MKYITIAILTWGHGQPIDCDLWFKLAALGYDVQALEDKYLAI